MDGPGRIGDKGERIAVIIAGAYGRPAQRLLKRGRGFVAANKCGTMVVAIYASKIPPSHKWRISIRSNINQRSTLILGDFNAKSMFSISHGAT